MMNKPPKFTPEGEISPMCKRLKSKHTQEELMACARKLIEFKKSKTGGAGIE